MVADEDHAVQSLHELADVYRSHSAMVAMLTVPSVSFADATVTCPGGKNRRRIGLSLLNSVAWLALCCTCSSQPSCCMFAQINFSRQSLMNGRD